jgi:hypothetical protein
VSNVLCQAGIWWPPRFSRGSRNIATRRGTDDGFVCAGEPPMWKLRIGNYVMFGAGIAPSAALRRMPGLLSESEKKGSRCYWNAQMVAAGGQHVAQKKRS